MTGLAGIPVCPVGHDRLCDCDHLSQGLLSEGSSVLVSDRSGALVVENNLGCREYRLWIVVRVVFLPAQLLVAY